MTSFMSLPQHQGAFSTFRLMSPVQLNSYSALTLRWHFEHSKIGITRAFHVASSASAQRESSRLILARTCSPGFAPLMKTE